MVMGGKFGTTGFLPLSPPIRPASFDPEQELAILKQQEQQLELQRKQIEQRIRELETGQQLVAVVQPEKCTGCGICEDACPQNAIKVNGQAIVQSERCIGCGLCVGACPNNAITLSPKQKR